MSESSRPASHHPIVCDVIVASGYVLMELAGVVEVLRLANRISKRDVFNWTYRSIAGGQIRSSSDTIVETIAFDARPAVDYAFVLGNTNADHPDLSLPKTLSLYAARHARVILLSEAASRYIANKGEDGTNHTTHWENSAALRESHVSLAAKSALAVDTGSIVTCAGMGATVDLTLSIASHYLSSARLRTVADILLHERIRHYNTLQPFGGGDTATTGIDGLDISIRLMHENIEAPLTIGEIAARSGLAKRTMERKFNSVLRMTPNKYYRELRLASANNLLLNTDMSINEIGLACGFPSGFHAVYKSTFGMTPSMARSKG